MKKVFIGLLIIAAGAGAFYLLQKKQRPVAENNFQKEWIIGTWKLDSIAVSKDSTNKLPGIIGIVAPDLMKYQYEFKESGLVLLSDSLKKDSSKYEWNKKDQLVWKEHPADASGELFTVFLLNKDRLYLQSADSVRLLFTKAKE